jgi:uncharacterized membrane protein HdeD (DUF308 family)
MINLTIQLLIVGTIVGVYLVVFGIFMLYQKAQHKKRIRQLELEIEGELEIGQYLDSQGMVIKKTDKLSPKKKMGKHTMR